MCFFSSFFLLFFSAQVLGHFDSLVGANDAGFVVGPGLMVADLALFSDISGLSGG